MGGQAILLPRPLQVDLHDSTHLPVAQTRHILLLPSYLRSQYRSTTCPSLLHFSYYPALNVAAGEKGSGDEDIACFALL